MPRGAARAARRTTSPGACRCGSCRDRERSFSRPDPEAPLAHRAHRVLLQAFRSRCDPPQGFPRHSPLRPGPGPCPADQRLSRLLGELPLQRSGSLASLPCGSSAVPALAEAAHRPAEAPAPLLPLVGESPAHDCPLGAARPYPCGPPGDSPAGLPSIRNT